MNFLLEYSEQQHAFHYNYINFAGGLNNKLNSNNYKPISVISEKLTENDDFVMVMDSLRKTNASFADAQATILWWLLNNEDKW